MVLLKTLITQKSSPANLSLFTVLPYLPSPIVSSEGEFFSLFHVIFSCNSVYDVIAVVNVAVVTCVCVLLKL